MIKMRYNHSIILFLFSFSISFCQSEYENLLEQTDEYMKQKNYKAAINTFKKAHEIDRNIIRSKDELMIEEATYYEHLGYLYLMDNQLKESNTYLLKAIEIDSTIILPYYNLACIHFRKEEFEQGLQHLERAFQNGYEDYNWLDEDEDLEDIRKTNEYKKLYDKYFSKKDIKLIKLYNDAHDYWDKENYKKAAKLFIKAAKLERKTTFIREWKMANAYLYTAFSYAYLNKYKTSIKWLKKYNSFNISRSEKAGIYSLIGGNYFLLKKYDDALENRMMALDIYIELNDSTQIADQAKEIGSLNLYNFKNYENAAKYYEIAIKHGYGNNEKIEKLSEDLAELIRYYISKFDFEKGFNLSELGYSTAKRSGLIEAQIVFGGLFGTYGALVNPAKSIPYLIETIDLLEQEVNVDLYDEDGIFKLGIYFYIISTYIKLGSKNEAQKYINKSINYINDKGRQKLYSPLVNYLFALDYTYKNDFLKAEVYHKKVIEITKPTEDWYTLVPISLGEIGAFQLINKQFEELKITISDLYKIDNNFSIKTALYLEVSLGIMLEDRNFTSEKLYKIISIIENEIDSQYGKLSPEAFDQVLVYYEWFALNSILNDNAGLAFIAIDKSKNRSLKKSFPSIKSNNDVFDKELYDFDPHLNDNESFVMVEEINSSSNMLYKMGSSLNLKGLEIDLQGNNFNQLFMYKIDNDSIYWHLAKKDSTIFNETTPNLKILAKVYLNMLKNSKVSRFEYHELSKILYSTIIEEEKSISNSKTKLIIAPDPIISNIPLETLIDQNGKYLVETLDISYIQSYTVLKLLRERNYTNTESKLLAFGGINYSNNDFTKIKDDEIELLINLRSNTNQYSTNDIFGSLGYSDWKPLPGSLEEINSIKGEFPQAEIFSGKNASESFIKSLSKNNELKKYNIIHFATHGVVMPDLPQLSSIILSSSQNENEDGYLTVNEIAQLEINADFVNLSACETGLGKVYAGDGVIGLTQAFMEAGANGVLVSLWPVEDQSTAIFMTSVYAKIADGFTYSFAITDTKRDFISGKYGEEYKKPYYWAPFVYYGK